LSDNFNNKKQPNQLGSKSLDIQANQTG